MYPLSKPAFGVPAKSRAALLTFTLYRNAKKVEAAWNRVTTKFKGDTT
jgi:hypothetical protein